MVQINRRSMNKMEKTLGKQEFEAYRILPSAIDENLQSAVNRRIAGSNPARGAKRLTHW
jgi:hypothetical protein